MTEAKAVDISLEALDKLVSEYMQAESLVEGEPGGRKGELRHICDKVYSCAAFDLSKALETVAETCPDVLEDSRLLFRMKKQQVRALLDTGTEEGRNEALAVVREELAPLAMHAYPEAYAEFRETMLLFAMPLSRDAPPEETRFERMYRSCRNVRIPRTLRQEVDFIAEAGCLSRTLRQTLGVHQPTLGLLVRYLAFTYQNAAEDPRMPVSETTRGVARSMLLEAREPPLLPLMSSSLNPTDIPEADIQHLKNSVGLSRQEAVESLRHAGGNLKEAFFFELDAMRIRKELLDDLVYEYAAQRDLAEVSDSEESDADSFEEVMWSTRQYSNADSGVTDMELDDAIEPRPHLGVHARSGSPPLPSSEVPGDVSGSRRYLGLHGRRASPPLEAIGEPDDVSEPRRYLGLHGRRASPPLGAIGVPDDVLGPRRYLGFHSRYGSPPLPGIEVPDDDLESRPYLGFYGRRGSPPLGAVGVPDDVSGFRPFLRSNVPAEFPLPQTDGVWDDSLQVRQGGVRESQPVEVPPTMVFSPPSPRRDSRDAPGLANRPHGYLRRPTAPAADAPRSPGGLPDAPLQRLTPAGAPCPPGDFPNVPRETPAASAAGRSGSATGPEANPVPPGGPASSGGHRWGRSMRRRFKARTVTLDAGGVMHYGVEGSDKPVRPPSKVPRWRGRPRSFKHGPVYMSRQIRRMMRESMATDPSSSINHGSYRQLVKLRRQLQSGKFEEVVKELQSLNPQFPEQHPDIMFELHCCRFEALLAEDKPQDAVLFAREHLAPLAERNPALMPSLQAAMASVTSASNAAGDENAEKRVASLLDSALLETLGLKEPQLVTFLKETLATHRAWFQLQQCRDVFAPFLQIDSLVTQPEGPEGAALERLPSLTRPPTGGSDTTDNSGGGRWDSLMRGRLDRHGADNNDDDQEEVEDEEGSHGLAVLSERAILTTMEFTGADRLQAIELLHAHGRDPHAVIAFLFP